jgi:hypothetical protein
MIVINRQKIRIEASIRDLLVSWVLKEYPITNSQEPMTNFEFIPIEGGYRRTTPNPVLLQ